MTRLIPLLLTGLLAHGAEAAPPDLRLRVVTFNVWGIPFASTHRKERLAAVGPAVARLKPDVVAFQEAWYGGDRTAIVRVLKDAGLAHHRYFRSGVMGSGLLVVSRYPIKEARFDAYRLSGKPHRLRHLDWYGGKGFAIVTLDTPRGEVNILNTHLHSSYGSGEYDQIKYGQILQLIEGLPDGSRPLIVLGDLNLRSGDAAMRILRARGRLRDAGKEAGKRVDHILIRDGGYLRVDASAFTRTLEGAADLPGGARAPLSNHPAYVADLILTDGLARAVPFSAVVPTVTVQDLAKSALEYRRRHKICLAAALALILAGTIFEAFSRRLVFQLMAGMVLAAGLVLLLFATQYLGPHTEGFRQAALSRIL